MRTGVLAIGEHSGRLSRVVLIIGETRTKYRVRLPDNARGSVALPGGRRRLIGAVSHLVPKDAVRIVGLGALLAEHPTTEEQADGDQGTNKGGEGK